MFTHAVSVAHASGARVLRIESDPHAGDFYRRLGARPAGRTPAPMPGHDDRCLPVLEFPLR